MKVYNLIKCLWTDERCFSSLWTIKNIIKGKQSWLERVSRYSLYKVGGGWWGGQTYPLWMPHQYSDASLSVPITALSLYPTYFSIAADMMLSPGNLSLSPIRVCECMYEWDKNSVCMLYNTLYWGSDFICRHTYTQTDRQTVRDSETVREKHLWLY